MSSETRRAADAPPFTHALPTTGGSFVVQKDGSLKEESAMEPILEEPALEEPALAAPVSEEPALEAPAPEPAPTPKTGTKGVKS